MLLCILRTSTRTTDFIFKYLRRAVMTQSTPFRPIVMSGPSGSGKSTLLKRLMNEYDGCFAFSVSHTTRKPRPGEVNGVDYHFVSKDEMMAEIDKNAFLEYAQFSGNMYGTSKRAVEDVSKTGKICILDVEVQGVKSIKNTDLTAKYIFIRTPNLKILEERLRGRGTETEDSLQKRLASATEALQYAEQNGVYDLIITNDDCDVAYEQLKGFLAEDLEKLKKSKFSR